MRNLNSLSLKFRPIFPRLLLSVSLFIAFLALPPLNTVAATRFWDGGGTTGFWDTAANWSNNVAPANGDALVFPDNAGRLTNTNRVTGNLTNISSIRFTGDGYNIISLPAINLINGLTNAAFIGSVNTLNAQLQPRANQTWSVSARTRLTINSNVAFPTTPITLTQEVASAGTLQLNGSFLGGPFVDLIKRGPGTLDLNGNTNIVDDFLVQDGIVNVDGFLNATMVVSNGATLQGIGSLSVVRCAGDLRPGGAGVGSMTFRAAAACAFAPGSRLFIDLNGLAPDTEYDQLRTVGKPDLSGAQLIVLRNQSFPFAVGQKFVIITNTLNVTPFVTTFTNLPQNARITNNGVVFQISYAGGNGNDVELTVVEAPFAPTGVTRVWDGGGGSGNHNWASAVNWDGNILPSVGDDLVFPSSVPNSLRPTQNNIAATNAVFNRLWFGGHVAAWQVRSNSLKLFGGVVATNELPLGNVTFDTASVELIGPQTWSGTNVNMALNAPLLLGGHTLTLASGASANIHIQEEVMGPGTLVALSGEVSFFNQIGASNITVTIQGGSVFAGFGTFTGPPWQMSGGELRLGSARIPGLQLTGGTLDLSGIVGASVAGNLTLAPAATVFAHFENSFNTPLVITGQVNLAGARLTASPANLSQLGTAATLLDKTSPGAVTGTFAGLSEGALFTATNEINGLVTLYRISYVGGNGNDITLTPIPPSPSSFTRTWTGAGANTLWPTAANWTGNTPPANGDTALFPVNAAQRANTNTTPGLVLNAVAWIGSNYLHSGTLSLLSGLRHGAAAGTNAITGGLLVAYGEQTWAVSNAAATLRVFQEDNDDPENLVAAAEKGGGIDGLGPVTKTGAGTLELENLTFGVSDGLIANGGTTRLTRMEFIKQVPLVLAQGRIEAMAVAVDFVTATNGELALHFGPGEEGVAGGLFSADSVTLSSNITLTVHWTNGAFVALQSFQLDLNNARLGLTFPPALPPDEVIRVARYAIDGLAGRFANLPEGAVTNFAGRAWQIRYDVTLPEENPNSRFITLAAPVVPPRFTNIQLLPSGDVLVQGVAGPGANVTIEASEFLEGFVDLDSVEANAAGQFSVLDRAGQFTRRLYRAFVP